MTNMSYCRFHNTLGDLRDCRDAIEEMAESIHNKRAYDALLPKWKAACDIEDPTEDQELDCDEMFEELDRLRNQIRGLSDSEYRAAKWLIELCESIAEDYSEDDLVQEPEYIR